MCTKQLEKFTFVPVLLWNALAVCKALWLIQNMTSVKVKMQIFDKSCTTSCRSLLNGICIILPKLIDYFLRSRQEKAALANSYQIFFDRYNIAWLWREIFLFCKSNILICQTLKLNEHVWSQKLGNLCQTNFRAQCFIYTIKQFLPTTWIQILRV